MNARRRGLLTVVIACAVVLAVGRAWGALIGDHAWFDALGYGDVWWWRTSVSLALKCAAGVLATLVMRTHLEAVRRSFVSVVVPGSVGNLEFTGAVPDRTISLVLWCIATAVGVLLTIPIDDWVVFANVLDARPLGETDPYFQYDLSFWTSWLPFENEAYTWALLSHAVMSLLTVLGYVLTRGIGSDGRAVRITRHARRHVTVLGAMLLLLIAWSYRLDGFDRLVHGTGAEGAFGFADHRVGLPGGIVMQVIALAASGVVVWSAWSRQPRAAIAAVTTVLLMALLLRQGMPLLADSVDGGGDSEARERRYLDAGASFTRRAYESDRVIVAAASDTASLAAAPLWDRATLPHGATGRVGALLAWKADDGMPQAIAFDALRATGLLPTWRTSAIDVTSADPLRLASTATSITLPPIVVSDSGRGYAIVSDPQHHIAAPSIAGLASRLAHAWNQQNPRLLFGVLPQPAPVLVTGRDVRTRVSLLVPTLQPGVHVTPLLHADSLLWALDLYAVSATYPLSEHVMLESNEVSAAQFAATALVNAHTGRVTLVTEGTPPLLARRPLRRLARHLVPAVSLPPTLRRALPPRGDAIELEAAIAARFGSRAVQDDTTNVVRKAGPLTELALVRGVIPDSSLTGDDFVPIWLAARRTYALTAAAIDARGIVRGVMIAPGGEDRRTRWQPSADGATYDGVLRAAQEVSDSLRQPGSLAGARRSSTRVLPGSGPPRFLTPYFTLRDGRPTQLAAVLLTDGMRRGVARDVAEASVDWRAGGRPIQPGSAAASMYRQMREALQRGAWTEFGAAFEALGRALGVPRDSMPR
ncbi:MAG TPA: UPF0182 family protein [Gemmatimonadaceae bacterium]|nr:UPF0182 family protein [Gemmatimonadaceae bacterium]